MASGSQNEYQGHNHQMGAGNNGHRISSRWKEPIRHAQTVKEAAASRKRSSAEAGLIDGKLKLNCCTQAKTRTCGRNQIPMRLDRVVRVPARLLALLPGHLMRSLLFQSSKQRGSQTLRFVNTDACTLKTGASRHPSKLRQTTTLLRLGIMANRRLQNAYRQS